MQNEPRNLPRVYKAARNTAGRDFCVGDIHGMFNLLDKLLRKLKFDPAADRMFSVGDLVDRGPDSARSLFFLNQPWFHAIRGNHEDMLLRHCAEPDDADGFDLWQRNGGEWWPGTSTMVQRQLHRWLQPLPLVIEVDTANGPVGIVHADLPVGLSWPDFLTHIEAGTAEVEATALWSRQRARLWKVAGKVPGVHAVCCGHTVMKDIVSAGNVHFIDTGACYEDLGRLTAIDLNLGPESAVQVGW